MNHNCTKQRDAGVNFRKSGGDERKLEKIGEQSTPRGAARRLLELAGQTGGSFTKMTLAESLQT